MALASGSRLGSYEIVAPIGAGGMGEVYRARDSKLDRDVAIKVLPLDLAKNETALARFEREAKAIAALAHPNILAIYDFGHEQGLHFVAVELLEGETLRDRMGNAPLPQRKVLDYGVQIAQGLAAAHDKGIVHRDLKPENIFVTRDGHIKILDFGLAKHEKPGQDTDSAPESETRARQTKPGAVMGTVGYMSPEQVRGQDADHRSDIFSFGTILYEMVSGQKTFHGDSAVETMNAILKQDPSELSQLKGDLSPALEQIIRRCLEKRVEERFQSARDLGFALEAVSGSASGVALPMQETQRRFPLRIVGVGALVLLAVVGFFLLSPRTDSPAGPKRIVVLPFENLGSADDAYFAAGMTEEITSRLGVVSGLGVISRKSALQYEGSTKALSRLGRSSASSTSSKEPCVGSTSKKAWVGFA